MREAGPGWRPVGQAGLTWPRENQWPARASAPIIDGMFRHAAAVFPATAGGTMAAAPVRVAYLPGKRR